MRIRGSFGRAGLAILLLPFFARSTASEQLSELRCGENVDLRIVPDKQVYEKGGTMHVRFFVTNLDDDPLYLFSFIDQCSSPLGWLALRLHDPRGNEVRSYACAVDFIMKEVRPAETLRDSRYGVMLRKNEIFGRVQEYKLPNERGTYRLRGDIGQVGHLTDDQNEALSENHMRVLRHTCSSPVATIKVR
jgi:hypothetical protein